MPTGYEVKMYHNIERVADSLQSISKVLSEHLPTIAESSVFKVDVSEQALQNAYDNIKESFIAAMEFEQIPMNSIVAIVTTVDDAVGNNFDRLTERP